MSDKSQPPSPSRRKLFTYLADHEAAGAVGAELGRIYHDVQESAYELAQASQEMADVAGGVDWPPWLHCG